MPRRRIRIFFFWVLLATAGIGLAGPVACVREASWEEAVVAGQAAFSRGDYDEAQRIFEAALKKAERFGFDDVRYALSLNHLAQTLQARGDYIKAEPRYLQALAIVQKARGDDHPDVAEILSHLGVLHRMHGQFSEAEAFLTRALAVKERAFGPHHQEVARGLQHLGALYMMQERWAMAEPFYKRALTIQERALGTTHPEVIKARRAYGVLAARVERQPELEGNAGVGTQGKTGKNASLTP